MTDEEYIQKHEDIIRKALDELGEHFDSVQVFATLPNQNSSESWHSFAQGRGNAYTRIGQIREWMICDDEKSRICERRADEEADD